MGPGEMFDMYQREKGNQTIYDRVGYMGRLEKRGNRGANVQSGGRDDLEYVRGICRRQLRIGGKAGSSCTSRVILDAARRL